jgi:hypothetical protein
MDCFGVPLFGTSTHTMEGSLHSETFPTVQTIHQLEFICKSYASHKLTYHVDHHGTRGCHITPCYSCIWGYPCEEFKEYSRRYKTLPQLRFEEVKNLPVDGYQTMLNISPLGEGVPLFCILSCSVAEKNI